MSSSPSSQDDPNVQENDAEHAANQGRPSLNDDLEVPERPTSAPPSIDSHTFFFFRPLAQNGYAPNGPPADDPNAFESFAQDDRTGALPFNGGFADPNKAPSSAKSEPFPSAPGYPNTTENPALFDQSGKYANLEKRTSSPSMITRRLAAMTLPSESSEGNNLEGTLNYLDLSSDSEPFLMPDPNDPNYNFDHLNDWQNQQQQQQQHHQHQQQQQQQDPRHNADGSYESDQRMNSGHMYHVGAGAMYGQRMGHMGMQQQGYSGGPNMPGWYGPGSGHPGMAMNLGPMAVGPSGGREMGYMAMPGQMPMHGPYGTGMSPLGHHPSGLPHLASGMSYGHPMNHNSLGPNMQLSGMSQLPNGQLVNGPLEGPQGHGGYAEISSRMNMGMAINMGMPMPMGMGMNMGMPMPMNMSVPMGMGMAMGMTEVPPNVCRFFLQGNCTRGERCSFIHTRDLLSPLSNSSPSPSSSSGAPSPSSYYPKKDPNLSSSMPGSTMGLSPSQPIMANPGSSPSNSSGSGLLGTSPSFEKDKLQKARTNVPLSPPNLPNGSRGFHKRGRSTGSAVSPASPTSPQMLSNSTNKKADNMLRFTSIEQVVGKVYQMCKDQHGCRFLQKKLEEQSPRAVEVVFKEVFDHIVELMTDPFGNYLCQKLIEHCDDYQRSAIVQCVAPSLVVISKNMHGTRAVQKMIECLSLPSQVQTVVQSLQSSVVELIQDLNGNHVIQRCLNKLSNDDKQFVYDAVSSNCVEVATHRHGCCVMQRCIDFSSEPQKLQLVSQITANVLVLVQDQYGNYVVQYVLDLPPHPVKSSLIRKFLGHLGHLSTQKFSSNVIEKCLQVSELDVKRAMIAELTESDNLNNLLQDPFGNYVIQTALQASDPNQHRLMVEAIKPHLPALRNTPYGKRIQNKITKESGI